MNDVPIVEGSRFLKDGSTVNSYKKAIDLTIHTKAPEKWLLIDMETGQEYVGSAEPNEYGKWIRIKDRVKSEAGYSVGKWSDDDDYRGPIVTFRGRLK